MRDFRDAKAMAQTLRSALAPKGVTVSHSECLEIIARIFGAKDWNVLSAMIEDSPARMPIAADRWSGPLLLSRDFILFPKQTAPLCIGREMSRRALVEAGRGNLEVLLVAQKNPYDEDPSPEAIYNVGVVADVLDWEDIKTGNALAKGVTIKLMLRARQRARIATVSNEDGRRHAEAVLIWSEANDEDTATMAVRTAFETLRSCLPGFEHFSHMSAEQQLRHLGRLENITKPDVLADVIAQLALASVAEKQRVLDTLEALPRLQAAVALLAPANSAGQL